LYVWHKSTIYAGDPTEEELRLNEVKGGTNESEKIDNEDQIANSEGMSEDVPQKVRDVVDHIQSHNGTPPKGYKGGRTYENDGRDNSQVLPEDTTYREYDVNPHVKGQDRGSKRVVIGEDSSVWYTNDHYGTFTRVK
jgi:guanyl-specific ribonuclease Sa